MGPNEELIDLLVRRSQLKYTSSEFDRLNSFLGDSNGNYLNHGYYPPYEGLVDYHKTFKHQASLYLQFFDNIDTENKSILEVGCGRGGGINLLNQRFNFKKVEACDLSEKNIDHCMTYSKDIVLDVQDAQRLTYEDNEFDILINIESSCYYTHIEEFFFQVKRVLKPDSIFLYTDVFEVANRADQVAKMLSNFFPNIEKEDITNNVQQACEQDITYLEHSLGNRPHKEDYIDLAKEKSELYSGDEYCYLKYICRT